MMIGHTVKTRSSIPLNYFMQGKSIKFLENSNIELDFTDKLMTSYGGFSLLAKLFEKLKLHENLEAIFPIVEISPNSKGIYSKLLKFGLTVIAGGQRFCHSAFLGDSDIIYQSMFGVEKMVKSPSSITRMFNKIESQFLSSLLAESLWKYIFNKIIPFSKIEEDYLNFDSKVITRYGVQEGVSVGYNSKKKGRPSHHPLMAFMNKQKYVVNIWNRDGRCSSGNGATGFLTETLARLDGKMKIKGCIGDTGFYKTELIKKLEELSIDYILGVPFYEVIQKQVLLLEEWQGVDQGLSVSEFKFQHKDEKWDKDRRYVVVRQEIEKVKKSKGKQLKLFKDDEEVSKYRYSCYVTSFDMPAVEVWREYRTRAADENIIKENTMDFGLEGFSLNSFYATEAAMLIRVLFYNIINFFRKEILAENESGKTLATLRYKYFVIPAALGRNGRKFVLRLGIRSKSKKSKIKWIISYIDEYFKTQFNCNAVET